eukprot:m.95151 g.95151  ORF g.95151 m.95151 type:complete len:507 (-) comp15440_c0_seq1:315-1835(-)
MALLGWLIAAAVLFLPVWVTCRVIYLVARYQLNKHKYKAFPHFPSSFAIMKCVESIDGFLDATWKAYQSAKKKDDGGSGRNPPFVHMGCSFDGSHVLVTVDPDAMRDLVENDKLFPKPEMYNSMVEILTGRGLIVLEGETWKAHRRLLTPIFHFKPLKSYMGIMHEHCDKFVQELIAANGPVAVLNKVPELTMSIICEIGVGGSLNPLEPLRIFKEAEKWFQPYYILGLFLVGPWLWRKLVFLPPVFMVDHKLKQIREMVLRIIDERRQGKNLGHGEDDVIGRLMAAQANAESPVPLSDTEIVNEAVTFLFAGHDTTSGIMTWILYFLAVNPTYQERLYKELMEIWPLDTPFEKVEEEVLKNELLRAIVNESLRLRPNTPAWLDRVAAEDVQIAGQVVPKGTIVGLGFQFLQTNPDHWERAEEFWPERFLESTGDRHNFAFVPFSAGSRNCLGMKFAQQEMGIFLATLVRSCTFAVDKNAKEPIVRKLVGMQVPSGLHMIFTARSH